MRRKRLPGMDFYTGVDSDRKRLLRYFRSFFLLLLVVALSFCCLQYLYTGYLVRQENETSSRNTFVLLKHAHDATFNQLLHTVTNLFTDRQFSSFMDYYRSNDVRQQLSVINTLNSIKNSLIELENICFYYPQYGYTLSTVQTISEIALYHDRDFLLSLRGSFFPSFRTFVRSVTFPFSASPTDVVSLVCTLPFSASDRSVKSYYLIIDLKYSAISASFSDVMLNNDSGLMIFDSQGTLISGAGKTYPLSALMDDSQPLSESITTAQRTIDGEPLSLYFTKNADMGWIYVYAQSARLFAQRLYQIRNVIVAVFLAVVTVGVLYAWFASKRLYRPIHQLSEQLGNQDVDVFDRIDGIIAQNERLNNQLQENLVTGRNQRLLQQMLLNFSGENGEQGRLNLQPAEKECAFFLLHTTLNESSLSSTEIKELFLENGMRLVIKLYPAPNEIACIVASTGFSPETILRPAQALLLRQRDKDGLINIGVSRPFQDVSSLAEAYRQAQEAMGMHLVRGEGTACCFWEIRNHPAPDYPYKLENAILRAFRDQDGEEMQKKLQEFQAYLVSSDAGAQSVRDFYVQLFCSCQRLILDLPTPASQGILHYSHRELISQPTLDDMNAYLQGMLLSLMNMSERPEGKSEMIERICSYIDAHLEEAPTVERLAAEFFVSPSGLRAEFTRVMGMSIKSYTDAQRLKLAKKLLENNSLRVLDIAGRLGFNYAQSFITFFKGATSMTPGEYRQMRNKEKIRLLDTTLPEDMREGPPEAAGKPDGSADNNE